MKSLCMALSTKVDYSDLLFILLFLSADITCQNSCHAALSQGGMYSRFHTTHIPSPCFYHYIVSSDLQKCLLPCILGSTAKSSVPFLQYPKVSTSK